jgi:phosphoserine aminotransferase
MRKVYNFSAGPGMLPEEVLLQAQAEILDWHGTGMSIMELGHRGPEFKEVADQAEADLRELMNIPKNYHVLFLPGGATAQFAMLPMNLFTHRKHADYIDTGIWSKKAIAEAERYGSVKLAAKLIIQNDLLKIPNQAEWNLSEEAAYVHYTPNETIEGVQFHWVPKTGNIPLIADMSSMILSEPVDVTEYGVIYAGAQKNIGQAGIGVVIIREDLVHDPLPGTPTLYMYKVHAENKSFYNTPPTYAWYIAGLVFAWLKRQGGVQAMAEINRRKAEKLYSFIDKHNEFYINPIDPSSRSKMNVPFNLKTPELTQLFLDSAEKAGLTNLKGHRLAGGVRASIYNAMPEAGVDALVEFMKEFMKKHG